MYIIHGSPMRLCCCVCFVVCTRWWDVSVSCYRTFLSCNTFGQCNNSLLDVWRHHWSCCDVVLTTSSLSTCDCCSFVFWSLFAKVFDSWAKIFLEIHVKSFRKASTKYLCLRLIVVWALQEKFKGRTLWRVNVSFGDACLKFAEHFRLTDRHV